MRIIETTAALEALTAELKTAPYIALDTEFMRDTTYWPKLCLLQIATKGVEAIVDPLAEGIDLSSFFTLLKMRKIVKVLHAARQDIEIFWNLGHAIPDPLFDTQIAAMVCGFGEAASYETLARKLAEVQLDKSARFTDWSRRPLTERQLSYAIADVTHLRVIYEKLAERLKRTGRDAWVAEEIHALQDKNLYTLDPVDAWRRLKPRSSNKRFLAMLAAVAAWREREAQSRDTPRGRVLKDEALLEIAASPPATAEGLERIRSVPRGFAASRLGKSLLETVAESKNAPPPAGLDGMAKPKRRKGTPTAASVDLLKTLLRMNAEKAEVAPHLIADSDEIERIAAGETDGVAALAGWRADVFGKDARALMQGKIALTIEDGDSSVVELDDPAD
jgi:ribonuclease D